MRLAQVQWLVKLIESVEGDSNPRSFRMWVATTSLCPLRYPRVGSSPGTRTQTVHCLKVVPPANWAREPYNFVALLGFEPRL